MKTTTKKDRIAARRARHHSALETLWRGKPSENPGGFALWRRLRKIERKASAAFTAQCNGETFAGQPYRSEDELDAFRCRIVAEVSKAFGGHPPAGLYLNSDPRGYAIQLDCDKTRIPEGLIRNWGGNGCLAAEIN